MRGSVACCIRSIYLVEIQSFSQKGWGLVVRGLCPFFSGYASSLKDGVNLTRRYSMQTILPKSLGLLFKKVLRILVRERKRVVYYDEWCSHCMFRDKPKVCPAFDICRNVDIVKTEHLH